MSQPSTCIGHMEDEEVRIVGCQRSDLPPPPEEPADGFSENGYYRLQIGLGNQTVWTRWFIDCGLPQWNWIRAKGHVNQVIASWRHETKKVQFTESDWERLRVRAPYPKWHDRRQRTSSIPPPPIRRRTFPWWSFGVLCLTVLAILMATR